MHNLHFTPNIIYPRSIHYIRINDPFINVHNHDVISKSECLAKAILFKYLNNLTPEILSGDSCLLSSFSLYKYYTI